MAVDYRQHILANLPGYPGLAREPALVDKVNSLLKTLAEAGLTALVDNFCNNPDAEGYLFEAWIGRLLLNNRDVQGLVYEPDTEQHPPDFRFTLCGVGFDVQAKRLRNVKNEMTKRLFQRECKRQLSTIQKPWFISFWVSNEFERVHLNEFFSHVRANMNAFKPASDPRLAVAANQYRWDRDGKVLVRFSFMEKNPGDPGIWPFIIEHVGTVDGMPDQVDVPATRRAVRRQLEKARPTLIQDVSSLHSNIVIVQPEPNISMGDDTMMDVLYGSKGRTMRHERGCGGLFDGRQYSRICGVVLVPAGVAPTGEQFTGVYFPNPMHLCHIEQHPKPFEWMTVFIPTEGLMETPCRSVSPGDAEGERE